METTLKTTQLNSWHRANGANMANFGGFDMPLWYETGVKLEHLAVVESAGIFDTSHMACVMVTGKDALNLLQLCHTRDLDSLKNGRCVYGAILNEKGHVIDDAIVYRFDETSYMVCVNAGMGTTVASHFQNHKSSLIAGHERPVEVTVTDLSEKVSKMDIQGKNSAKILKKVLHNPDTLFEKMPYFSFKGDLSADSKARLKNGTPLLLSRSGYTGEFGFEMFISPDAIVQLWQDILEAGKEYNLIACGLGARDSLRAGSVLPLSHQDVGNWKFVNTPWSFALPYDSDKSGFTKTFIGSEALLSSENSKNENGTRYTFAFVGQDLRKIGAGSDSQVIDGNGKAIGTVLTCATDMAIGWHNNKIYSIASPDLPEGFKAKGISCGFVLVDRKLDIGTKLVLQEKNRKINVTIVDDVRPHRTARGKISNFI
ncbi:MAG: aminomethyl transferase family protein [Desulfamplus sp.]|nr:aminomethyl transferase family protein [Desulfamplus sp.]